MSNHHHHHPEDVRVVHALSEAETTVRHRHLDGSHDSTAAARTSAVAAYSALLDHVSTLRARAEEAERVRDELLRMHQANFLSCDIEGCARFATRVTWGGGWFCDDHSEPGTEEMDQAVHVRRIEEVLAHGSR